MAYAKKLTKADLIADGITDITKEGRVFKGSKEIFPHWIPNKTTGDYLGIFIYERDSEGHLIKGKDSIYKYTRKDSSIGECVSWAAKSRTIGLHRAIWAWYNEEVPEGYIVDHINNQHSTLEDYHLNNLQLLTPKENVTKDRLCNIREIKCQLNKPRYFYEDKLNKFEALHKKAKLEKNAEEAHKLRTYIAQTKARLRYYDNHIEEAQKKSEYKKDLMELAYWKKIFKPVNKRLWRECCTIERAIKTKGQEAWPMVKHALEVIHKHYERTSNGKDFT